MNTKFNFLIRLALLSLIFSLIMGTACNNYEIKYTGEIKEKEKEKEEGRITKFPTDFPIHGQLNWEPNLASDSLTWFTNWKDDSSNTDTIQYQFVEESLRFWTAAGTNQRPKVTHKKRDFTVGEYHWKVYIPEMQMNAKVSIGAFLYHDGDHEIDFEIGSGTSAMRKKYFAEDNEVLMFLTSQNFPAHQYVHPIQTERWYDLSIKLSETSDKKYYLEWYVNGNKVDEVKMEFGKDIPFGVHCSLENLDFMGDVRSSREHYVLFEKVGFNSSEDPGGSVSLPKVGLKTARKSGEKIRLKFKANDADQLNCWIDLNNNGVKDEKESIYTFDEYCDYIIGSQQFNIYGNFTRLDCNDNEINEIDVSEQTGLDWLNCEKNMIKTLDISKNRVLTYLDCDDNELTVLELNNNRELIYLSCNGSNEIGTLDVSNNTKLEFMAVSDNKLTGLDVSKQNNLNWLNCANNQLITLTVSKNGTLSYLKCFDNRINGNNMNSLIESLPQRKASDKAELIIISTTSENEKNIATPDNVNNAKSKGWKVLDHNNGEPVEYPGQSGEDPGQPGNSGTKTVLTTSKAVNEKVSLKIRAADAEQKNCWIDLNNDGKKGDNEQINFETEDYVEYVIGSQKFTLYGEITRLDCDNNNIVEVDLSGHPNLNWLNCESNQLKSLDISKNVNITYLDCDGNNLTVLDVANNKNLVYLSCDANAIEVLDVSDHANLNFLACAGNKLQVLDISKSTEFDAKLDCSNNNLTTLNISNNPKLTELNCAHNNITRLTVSSTGNLKKIECWHNQITGSNMTSFVNSLPTRNSGEDAKLIIADEEWDGEGNKATTDDVIIATGKGWKVLNTNNDNYAGI